MQKSFEKEDRYAFITLIINKWHLLSKYPILPFIHNIHHSSKQTVILTRLYDSLSLRRSAWRYVSQCPCSFKL